MMSNRLNALVQSGKLTQADADTILDWWTSRPAAANTLLERLLESRGRGHVGPKRFGKAQGLPGLHAGMIAGTIASVDSANGQLTVNLMRGDTLTLRIDSTTIICLDGKPSTLDKLQSGEEVMVAYNPDNDTALRIMVWPSRPWRLHPSGSP